MKKLSLLFFMMVAASIGWSQNYNVLTLYYTQGKFEEAKKEIDKLAEDPKAKDKAETYLWQFIIDAELYADSALHQKYPNAGENAITALNMYTEKEPDLKKLKEQGMRSVSNLYGQSFNYGRDYFQAQDWNNSFKFFNLCQQTSEYIGKNKLNSNGEYTIDTTVVLYTAYAAQNAGKMDEAAKRYKALADWKVKDKEYEDIYKYILDYDIRNKNEESFTKYLALAKEFYPEDMAIWNQIEMNNLTNNSSLIDIMQKYNEDDAAGKLKAADYITYGETFAAPDKEQLDKLDSLQQVELKLTAANAFAKAYKLDSSNGILAFNAGVLYYGNFAALDDQYFALRGEDAKLKSKRDSVVKKQQEVAADAINWLEIAYNQLKAKDDRSKPESNSLNRTVDYLANLYLWKRDRSRGTDTKAYDKYDAKYKVFDAEHEKYKPTAE